MPALPAPPTPLPPGRVPVDFDPVEANGHTTVDGPLAALALRQHGVVSAQQLASLGLSPSSVTHRVSTGRLHRVHRAVYAVGHRHLDIGGRRMATVLACGAGAVLSHESAAELWGIRSGSGARWHVTAPGLSGGRTGPPGVVVHRTRHLDPVDVTEVNGIPVTSLARTLLDLAGVVPSHAIARAVHEAEILGLLDVAAVLDVIERVPGRRGAARLRSSVAAPNDGVSSEAFVDAFLRLCRRHGLPIPRVSVHLPTAERLVECDVVFPDHRVVVELDSERFHHTRRSFHNDRRRDSALAAEGYLTIRLTWRRVTRESAGVARELRSILGGRAPAPTRRVPVESA